MTTPDPPKTIKAGDLSDFYEEQRENPIGAVINLMAKAGYDEDELRDMEIVELLQQGEDFINSYVDGLELDNPLPKQPARTRTGRGSRSRR